MPHKPKKALVEWLGREDHGKFEIVDKGWIKNFDPDKWKSTPPSERDESEVVEWRVGKKPQSGFYQSFDAKILNISSKIATLKALKAETEEAAKEAVKKAQSGREKKSKEGNQVDESRKRKSDQADDLAKSAKKNTRDGVEDNNEKNDDEVVMDSQNRAGVSGVKKPKHGGKDSSKSSSSSSSSGSSSSDHSASSDEDDDVVLSKADKREAKKKADEHTFGKLKKKVSTKSQTKEKKSSENSKFQHSHKVPIHQGSPYYVDCAQYEHIKNQSCASFVSAMLHQLFKTDVLVVSNLRGGLRKNQDKFRRWCLDPKKRLAIVNATQSLFPKKSQVFIHRLITSHIGNLRHRLMEKGKLAKYEAKGKKRMQVVPYKADEPESEISSF